MTVRNSFADENSSPMVYEDLLPVERERDEVERERVVVERERDAAGFLAAVERDAAGFFFAAVERDAAGFFAAVERDAAGFLAAVERDAAGLRAAVLRDDDEDDDERRPGTSRAATRRARFSTSLRRLLRSSPTLRDESSSRMRPTVFEISSTVFFFAFLAMGASLI
jgi:hypothetical protein